MLFRSKYKFRYHLKIVPDVPEAPWFVYGKLVHKIAEVYVEKQGKIDIQDIAKDCLAGNIVVEEGKGPPQLVGDYTTKLWTHIKCIKQLSDKIGYDGYLEHPFYYDLDPPHGYYVKGFIDRLIVRGDKLFILDYKTTSKYKTFRKLGGADVNGTVGGVGGSSSLISGLWMSTSAIGYIKIASMTSTLQQYSTFALYGVS